MYASHTVWPAESGRQKYSLQRRMHSQLWVCRVPQKAAGRAAVAAMSLRHRGGGTHAARVAAGLQRYSAASSEQLAWGVGRLAARREKVYLAGLSKPPKWAPATSTPHAMVGHAPPCATATRKAGSACRSCGGGSGGGWSGGCGMAAAGPISCAHPLTCKSHRLRSSCRPGKSGRPIWMAPP